MSRRDEYLDQGVSDASDAESGYDSEAAEVSRTERRGVKRRKLSHSSVSADSDEEDGGATVVLKGRAKAAVAPRPAQVSSVQSRQQNHMSDIQQKAADNADADDDTAGREMNYKIKSASTSIKKSSKPKKEKTPGVIYLSSLPPYLKPSALRNLLAQRGFQPVTRLFLTPASKHKHNSKKNSRTLYTEGWIEFASKKTAKQCADALNAQLVGGKKGGFYYDDLWNMRYLSGMRWEELMAGIREERREEEGRRDEERRKINEETRAYVEGVERGKKMEGMRKKRKMKAQGGRDGDGDDFQRTWRQHEVAKDRTEKGDGNKKSFDPEVQSVLSKIF